ncbi:MAG: CHAD domain-containing protein [Terracidiphilus sp.]|jgi:CHAD domain-containing protein
MTHELERARKALRELGKSLKSLPGNPPPRGVHKLRTTTRRVEAMAAALPPGDEKKSRRLLKSIETVRKAAGSVRDMDVMLANAHRLGRRSAGDSLTRLIEHLQIARQQQAEALERALGHRRDSARENLKAYSRLVRAALAAEKKKDASEDGLPVPPPENLQTAATDTARVLGSWPPLDAENIHAFRLKVKELRYILQLSADADPALIDALTAAQRCIGDWHDWLQLEEIAREVLVREEDGALLKRIDQTVRRKYSKALAEANSLRGKYLTAPLAYGA